MGADSQPVITDIALLRVDDLVNLRIRTVNLMLDDHGEQPVLISANADRESLLVVSFPAQTIVEQAYLESGGEASGQPLPGDNSWTPPPPPPPTRGFSRPP